MAGKRKRRKFGFDLNRMETIDEGWKKFIKTMKSVKKVHTIDIKFDG